MYARIRITKGDLFVVNTAPRQLFEVMADPSTLYPPIAYPTTYPLQNTQPIPAMEPTVETNAVIAIVIGAIAFCAVVITITVMMARRSKAVLRRVTETPIVSSV
jgi:hypothetical protein